VIIQTQGPLEAISLQKKYIEEYMDDNQQYEDPYQNQYWYGNEQSSGEPAVSNEDPDTFIKPLPPPPPPLPNYKYPEQQQYRRGRSSLWIFLVLLVVLLAGGGVGGFFLLRNLHGNSQGQQTQRNSNSTPAQVQAQGQVTLPVTSHPTVIIENDAGFIHVKAGSTSSQVTLQLGQVSNGNNGSASGTLPYIETDDHSTIVLTLSPPGGSDLTVTVPATTDLKLYTNDKAITVDGVSGQMNLLSNSGSVTVTNSTINTASSLNDNSGVINATHDALQGNVTLSNNSGDITFSGSIDPAGLYTFQDNGGTVNVSLPRNASFHVDATDNISTVSSDFPSVRVQNGEIHASVGKAPHATVTLKNNTGKISLHTVGE
jgi:hypothetical protein